MDSEVVKQFNTELVSLYELKPPISKKKIVDITKSAMKAIKFYKHVVFCVEKFLTKCKPDYKIPGLYCIDSIIRQSRHQFKDKDVFGPRFAANMPSTLSNLLLCKTDEKPRVVRVLNLWRSHNVFDEAQVRPWLNYCRDHHNLETDFAEVEKAVKGESADMSIYTRQQMKAERRKIAEPQTPPQVKPEQRSHTPPMPVHEPSDDCVEGGVSERETLDIMTTMGLDLGGMFSSDHALLERMHKLVSDKLVERKELDSQRKGNIKNLLSNDFDYSDEEESGDEESTSRLQVDQRSNELTKQQIMGMAEAVLREPDTKEEIQRLHTERLSALTQAAAARVHVARQNAATIAAVAAVANAAAAASRSAAAAAVAAISSPVTAPPLNIPLTAVAAAAAAAAGGGATGGIQLPSGLMMPSGPPPTGAVPNFAQFAPNIPPPNFASIPPPQSLGAAVAEQQQQHMGGGGAQRGMENDQDDRMRRHDDRDDRRERDREGRGDDRRHGRSRWDRDPERQMGRDRERDRDYGDTRGAGDRSSKRSRHSKSKERDKSGDNRQREHRGNGTDERRGLSRGREREKDSASREIERQKRKMGIPWPAKDSHVIIASSTLWFGRIPANCSDDDIRLSLLDAGEPLKISIINTRACAYVTMKDRKSAFRAIDKFQKTVLVGRKNCKLNWAVGQGLKKDEKYSTHWDLEHGVSQIPFSELPEDLDELCEGGHLEVETLPPDLAGLYDEHGLKGKKGNEEVSMMPADVPMPAGAPPNLPPFPFPGNQPPQMGQMPPFFPPGMMPFPIPPGGPGGSNQQPPGGNPPGQGPASGGNAIPMGGMRMPNGMPGPGPMMPPNFGGPPPHFGGRPPFHGGGPPPGFRGAPPGFPGRGGFNGGFDGGFRGRPPFQGPPNMQMMGNMPPGFMPPRGFPHGIRPPFGLPPMMHNSMIPMPEEHRMEGAEKRKHSGEENDESDVKLRKEDDLGDEIVPTSINSSNLTSINVGEDGESAENRAQEHMEDGAETSKDQEEAGEEHVTSTTHDDEASENRMPHVVEVDLNEGDESGEQGQNVDLKAVTQTEDEMLENAIIYSHEADE